ncbi:MAG: 3-hydroxyacyl-CoA dehydrogenase family protein [Candidatus Abyssobacteria bacterium SURF_17]|uniref:3-hydroxyacyl-CoA dehydrogenase family protein n=1 Tax=Candidatus Abyssobacteria bacterium SURF_17 TaxID=2093361 RepID=A0A419EX74_9BACT|nr:MAG: 3-hydroxyacyl-CoA dehydrogenase family protein [Candidatus Abyssubacteria bacterium SURF_17]
MSIENICIIGAGTMGRLLTVWALERGYTVSACDTSRNALDTARSRIPAKEFSARLTATEDMEKCACRADLVVDATPDNIEAKKVLFNELDSMCPKHTIVLSCTATIPLAVLNAVVERPERTVIANFWFDTPLVEIVKREPTAGRVMDAVKGFAELLGKRPVVLTRDCPGHACCRMFLGQVYRALRIIEAEVATAEDVDTCMTLGSAYSSGIMRRCDRMGLDFVYQAFLSLYELTGEHRFKPNRVLEEKIAAGKLGQKSGEGFFVWPNLNSAS